jgi:shikimate dehydrogenase
MSGPRPVTGRAGVIGSPIRHSLSPALFTAAFQAAGLDWRYDAFEVPAGEAPGFLAGEGAGLDGVSVTMPHKAAVIPVLDALDPVAERLGAVNCIARGADGRRTGHNTDGAGFLDALRADAELEVAGLRTLVLGAGGAARAVALALAEAGAREVLVVNRSGDRAAQAVELLGPVGRIGTPAEAGDAELVVNATSVGMGDDDGVPIDPALLGPGQTVVDIVYHPLETPLLRAAAARGAATVGGLGMLVHQAAHAFRLWLGRPAPVDAMRAGALAELAAREAS